MFMFLLLFRLLPVVVLAVVPVAPVLLVVVLVIDVCSLFRILQVVDTLAVQYPIPEAETSVTVVLTSLSVTISQIDPEGFSGFEFTPPSEFTNPTAAVIDEGGPSDNPLPAVSLSIPQSLFDGILLPPTSGNLPRISNIVYETDGLFGTVPPTASFIVSATLSVGSGIVQVNNLNTPIILTFEKLFNFEAFSCNFWDFDGIANHIR